MQSFSFIYIPLYVIYYIIKRIVFTILYPFCYLLRKKATRIRLSYVYEEDWEQHRNIRFKVNLIKPSILELFVWFGLDDAPYFSTGKEYYDYKCPKWLPTRFLKSYYWGAIRNNSVNLSRYISPGNCDESIVKEYKFIKITYRKYKNYWFKTLPMIEIFIGNKFKFKIGWKHYGVFSFRLTKL